MSLISLASPELEISITISFFSIIPKSPWLASTGWRKSETIPVEVKVEAILFAI